MGSPLLTALIYSTLPLLKGTRSAGVEILLRYAGGFVPIICPGNRPYFDQVDDLVGRFAPQFGTTFRDTGALRGALSDPGLRAKNLMSSPDSDNTFNRTKG